MLRIADVRLRKPLAGGLVLLLATAVAADAHAALAAARRGRGPRGRTRGRPRGAGAGPAAVGAVAPGGAAAARPAQERASTAFVRSLALPAPEVVGAWGPPATLPGYAIDMVLLPTGKILLLGPGADPGRRWRAAQHIARVPVGPGDAGRGTGGRDAAAARLRPRRRRRQRADLLLRPIAAADGRGVHGGRHARRRAPGADLQGRALRADVRSLDKEVDAPAGHAGGSLVPRPGPAGRRADRGPLGPRRVGHGEHERRPRGLHPVARARRRRLVEALRPLERRLGRRHARLLSAPAHAAVRQAADARPQPDGRRAAGSGAPGVGRDGMDPASRPQRLAPDRQRRPAARRPVGLVARGDRRRVLRQRAAAPLDRHRRDRRHHEPGEPELDHRREPRAGSQRRALERQPRPAARRRDGDGRRGGRRLGR